MLAVTCRCCISHSGSICGGSGVCVHPIHVKGGERPVNSHVVSPEQHRHERSPPRGAFCMLTMHSGTWNVEN